MTALRPQRPRPAAECLRLLGRLCIARDPAERLALLDRLARPERGAVLSFLNQHAVNLSWSDAEFRAALEASDWLLRDGIGLAACLHLLGREPGLNLNGTDLIPDILRAYSGRPVMLAGTATPWLDRAAARVEEMGCVVVAARHGFLPPDAYLTLARATRPELIVLGMGMPKQERLAPLLAQALAPEPVLVVNGGAVLDFLAGRFPRAPRALRRMGLEWAFRLAREPARLSGRYVLGGGAFAWRALWLAAAREVR